MKTPYKFDYVVPEVTREYWKLIMVKLPEMNFGFYGLDEHRTILHRQMAEHYGLTEEETTVITDHLDKIEYGSEGLNYKLAEMALEKQRKAAL